MPKEQISSQDITDAAYKIYSADEIHHMPKQMLMSLCGMLREKLEKRGVAGVKQEELEGVKDMLENHLYPQPSRELLEDYQISQMRS
jgi:hypothetical protein